MKIKTDHITNSSSTSFIIGDYSKDGKLGKLNISVEVDLDKLITDVSTSIEEIDHTFSFRDSINYDTKRMKEVIKNGGRVVILYINSESDDPTELYLFKNGLKNIISKPDEIEIIYGNSGY